MMTTQVFDDMSAGLTKFTNVVVEVTVTVPQYLNTVQILSYLLDIAGPLTEVLEGTDPGKRLHSVVEDLTSTRDTVGKALTPFADCLSTVMKALQPIIQFLNKMFSELGDGAKAVLATLKKGGDMLRPITEGFNKVMHAIAPVRWALEAVSCIVNKVLMPVINKILEVTGLKHLLDEAEEKVMKMLGLGSLLDAVMAVDPKAIGNQGSAVNDKAGDNSAELMCQLGSALGGYSTNKSEALKKTTYALVGAITGTVVDPNKGSIIPPFPEMPDLHRASSSSFSHTLKSTCLLGGVAAQAAHSTRMATAVKAVHSSVASLGVSPTMSLLTMHTHTPLVLLATPAPAPLNAAEEAAPSSFPPSIDATMYPHSAKFVEDVHASIAGVTALTASVATLSKSLTSLEASLAFPAHFEQQVTSMHTCFHTCSDLITFLDGLKYQVLSSIMDPVNDVVQMQLSAADDVSAAVPLLKSAVAYLATAAEGVVDQMPSTAVVSKAVHTMDGWVLGLQQLVHSLELGYDGGSDDTSALDDCKGHVESNAHALGARLETITSTVATLTSSVTAMQTALDTYSSALGEVTAHSQKMSTESLPALQHIAKTMGTLDSIFDPLSSLLEAEQCVDKSSPAKATCQTSVSILLSNVKRHLPEGLKDTLAKFASDSLPLGDIDTAVKHCTHTVDTHVVDAFETHAHTLQDGLKALGEALAATHTYSYTAKDGTVYHTPNDLVDQAMVDKALSINVVPAQK
ncbi:hypothetical protein KIPB_007451 [Kipferlia bialata]|uniref:Uncharacterized protein n=1 Tax=Kipferlia bialata TaxID=797122 RepID=A0A391NMY7_9EUKA|nr:hypothetical protein KIPB_007451 [Kipferlia bialata]|eukprot:g7451.t1